jgi:hypothetical protein
MREKWVGERRPFSAALKMPFVRGNLGISEDHKSKG